MKLSRALLVLCVLLSSSGCAILRPFVKDLDGWDLSACADDKGFKVCKELFLDNQEKIFGGKKAIDLLLDHLKNRTEVMVEDQDGTIGSESN